LSFVEKTTGTHLFILTEAHLVNTKKYIMAIGGRLLGWMVIMNIEWKIYEAVATHCEVPKL